MTFLMRKRKRQIFKPSFFKYVIHWPWFIASILICMALAFIYLRYQAPVYEVASSVLIKEDDNKKSANNALAAMQDFGMFSMTSNFDNESGNPKITHAHQESRITPESLYKQ